MPKPIYFGPSAPFINGNIIMQIQTDEKLIKNDLIQLLMTVPGERVMRPDFGTPLRLFPFELMDDAAILNLKSTISTAILRYENRFKTSSVDIVKDEKNNLVKIKIFGIPSFSNVPQLIIELNLPFSGSNVEVK